MSPPGFAKRALVQRIVTFIERLEQAGREPRLYEADRVLAALGHLSTGAYPQGETAMQEAELADAAPPERQTEVRLSSEQATVKHLRDWLNSIEAQDES